uniref:Uncharacterized protein n=1 Tax=Nelumbo nucifera TaxID=4432 RepID=A0A822YV40_NELNU|nr:TPA_asm: hypothetical protein HUJ06_007031 [Nelumbo nucifera]
MRFQSMKGRFCCGSNLDISFFSFPILLFFLLDSERGLQANREDHGKQIEVYARFISKFQHTFSPCRQIVGPGPFTRIGPNPVQLTPL